MPELDGSQVAEISSSQGGPCYSHDEIAEAQARTSDDLAGQPAGSNADDQYDEEAFHPIGSFWRPYHREPGG